MASDVRGRIQADLNAARKARDKERTLVLSTALSEIRNREIDTGREIDDDGVVEVLTRGVKQRRESADQMRAGGREELARAEEAQVEILSEYLPEPLSEPEVRALVREAIADGASEVGPLMGRLMPRIRGRFDGKEANRIVREELAR